MCSEQAAGDRAQRGASPPQQTLHAPQGSRLGPLFAHGVCAHFQKSHPGFHQFSTGQRPTCFSYLLRTRLLNSISSQRETEHNRRRVLTSALCSVALLQVYCVPAAVIVAWGAGPPAATGWTLRFGVLSDLMFFSFQSPLSP